MPLPLVILSTLLIAASAALVVYWTAIIWHIHRTTRLIPTCRDALDLPIAAELRKPSAPKVCIIVPAHNEAGVVGHLCASLIKQTYPNLRTVFALDRCTDSTAAEIRHETAGGDNFELFEIHDCPQDWAAKVNAVWRTVQSSRSAHDADILLFTDADTIFHPDCVRASVALLLHRNLGMLSLLSTLTADRWFEKVAQPAAGMELMRQYPLIRANAASHRRAFANGQFMLFTRAAYTSIGGHESAKDAVLEDIDLARLAERRAVPAGLFLADGLLTCRMYASPAEFIRGWKRIFIEAANRRISRLKQIARRVAALSLGPPFCCLAAAAIVWTQPANPLTHTAAVFAALAMLAMLIATGWAYRLSHVPIRYAVLYPVGALQVAHILRSAANDLKNKVPTRWAGRDYIREAR